jgi:hypothetical protein
MSIKAWCVLLGIGVVAACASAEPPPPVSPPPPDEGPGVIEGMVSAARDGGQERATSGQGLLEGMVAGSREGGSPSRSASKDAGPAP